MARALKRAQLKDRLGRYLITGAGILVLLGVGTILVFLVRESLPLMLCSEQHPEGALSKMLLPQSYDGYTGTQYVWQSESDKFGVPLLMWGTLKAAVWAMIFSVPLSLLAAVFVSEFSGPRLRTIIKSSIELLAGIPTVVVGFLAFVTLSTVLSQYYAAHAAYFENGLWVLFLVQILAFVFLGSVGTASVLERKWPLALAIAGVTGALAAALLIVYAGGALLEQAAGGALKPFFGIARYRQLNGALAGFCLGFAIIPVIFSVAEDAMKAVPASHREASLALGASKWQTAVQVVVPAASPGICAAIMLGLGRAVGETMIVLMASGNTPVFDLSPLTGMRTMSAAIAIEAPEKAQYSTGYHVLFFVGALLFLMTFAINGSTKWTLSRLKRRFRAGE